MPAGFVIKALLIIFELFILFVDKILTLPRSFTSTIATLILSSLEAFIQKLRASLGPKTILLSYGGVVPVISSINLACSPAKR